MEVLTQVPETGTKLTLDIDRQIDRGATTGDSVLRIQGQSPDGGQVFDAAYVECSDQEADLIAFMLRMFNAPTLRTQDWLAQEIHAMFGSKLSARDASQIATAVTQGLWTAAAQQAGIGDAERAEQTVLKLAERFERAADKKRTPYTTATNGAESPGTSSPRSSSGVGR